MPSCLTQTVTDLTVFWLLSMNMYCRHYLFEYQVFYSILCLVEFRRLWKYGSFHTDCCCYLLLNDRINIIEIPSGTDFKLGLSQIPFPFCLFRILFHCYYLKENKRNVPLGSMLQGFITLPSLCGSTCSPAYPFYSHACISSRSQKKWNLC